MGNFLDAAKQDKDSHEIKTFNGLDAAATGMQGWRLEMEDAHIISDMPSKSDHSLFAIFDGHGGAGAAIFAADNLIRLIEETDDWKNYIASNGDENPELIGNSIKKAYFEMDRILRIHQETVNSADTSGCTAVCAMVTPNYVICVNAGDSRCVIGSNGTTIPLSEDHKPQDDIERSRIENAGGTVQWKRVDGDLAVSRAFGDFQYKNRPDLSASEQKVSCEPDVRVHTRTPQDDILLLACDGLWDVFSNSQAVELAREIMKSGETSAVLISEEMIDSALNKGSKDNISCISVLMPGCAFGPPEGGGVLAMRSKREAEAKLNMEAANSKSSENLK